MNKDKTTFTPVREFLPVSPGVNPIVFIEWHEHMSRALGGCQCLLRANSDGVRPEMDPIIAGLPLGQALTPDQLVLKNAANDKIDTWNANCYRAIEMLKLSIDPFMHHLAGDLWLVPHAIQHQPDHTFRSIVNRFRTFYMGPPGDQAAITENRQKMTTKLNTLPLVYTDDQAHRWFIEVEKIMRQLIALNAAPMTGADMRALVSAAFQGPIFVFDLLQINRVLVPPETMIEIKNIWSHCALLGRKFVLERPVRPSPPALYAVAEAHAGQHEQQLRQLVVQSQGQVRQPPTQAEIAAFQRGRESMQSPSDRGREREPSWERAPRSHEVAAGGGDRDRRPSRFSPGGREAGGRFGAGGGQYPGAAGGGSGGRFGAGGGQYAGGGFDGRSFGAGGGHYAGDGSDGRFGAGGGWHAAAAGGGGERSAAAGRANPRGNKFRRVQAIQFPDGTLEYLGEKPVEVFGVESEDAAFFNSHSDQPQQAFSEQQYSHPYQPQPVHPAQSFQPPYPTQPPPPHLDEFTAGL